MDLFCVCFSLYFVCVCILYNIYFYYILLPVTVFPLHCISKVNINLWRRNVRESVRMKKRGEAVYRLKCCFLCFFWGLIYFKSGGESGREQRRRSFVIVFYFLMYLNDGQILSLQLHIHIYMYICTVSILETVDASWLLLLLLLLLLKLLMFCLGKTVWTINLPNKRSKKE